MKVQALQRGKKTRRRVGRIGRGSGKKQTAAGQDQSDAEGAVVLGPPAIPALASPQLVVRHVMKATLRMHR